MEEMVGMKMAPPISLRDFLLEYKETLNSDLKELHDLYDTDVESLEDDCCIEKLEQDSDPYVSEFDPAFSERNRVCADVLESQAYELQTFKSLHEYKKNVVKNPFERTRDSFKAPDIIPKMTDTQTDIDIENELLIWVRVYRPARATHIGQSLESPVFAAEFVCLGSNLLTELRDKISCICNGKRFFDISEDPDQPVVGKDTDPGYFFITDTFYNDMRNENNPDYSETVITWAKKAPGMQKMKFKVAKMEETRFIDLTVSIGFPQQYQHHGNCEHIFTFSQVELLTPHMKLYSRVEYPLLMSFNTFNTRLCHMCSHCVYSFVVEGCDRQLHDPAYLCEKCFKRYHYLDGKKIGTFRAYRIQDSIQSFEDDFINDSDSVSESNDNTNADAEDLDEMSPSTSKGAKKAQGKKSKEVVKPKRIYAKRPVKPKENEEQQKPKRVYKKKNSDKATNIESDIALVKPKRTYKPRKSKILDLEPSTPNPPSNEGKPTEQEDVTEKVDEISSTKKQSARKKEPALKKNTGTLPKKQNIKSESSEKSHISTSAVNKDEQKFIEEAVFEFEKPNQDDKTDNLVDNKDDMEVQNQMESIFAMEKSSDFIDNDDNLEFLNVTPPETENNQSMSQESPTKMNLRRSMRKIEERNMLEQLLADLT